MKNTSAYIWGLLGKLGPQILYLCTTFILARFLSPDDFGIIGVLTIFTSVSQTLLDAGLGGSLIKEENVTDEDYSTIFIFNIGVSLLLYLLIFICAPYIEKFYAIKNLSTICRVLCLVFVINSWGQIAQTILFRNLQFKKLMISSMASVIVGSIVSIFCAIWWKWGVYSLVNYQLVHAVTYITLNWLFCHYTPTFKFSIQSFKKLFSFGFFTTAIGIIESIYENLIASLFGKYLGIAQAGYFSQAKRIETASVSSLSGTINSVSFPILTRLRKDESDFIKEATVLLKNLSLIILPLLLGIALFSESLMNILFGKEWIKGAPYLEILMWVGCIFVLEAANRNFIKSLGLIKNLLYVTIIKRLIAIGIIVACIILNPNLILHGYLLGAAVGYLANAFCYSKIIKVNFWYYFLSSSRFIIPPLLCYFLGLLVKYFFYVDSKIIYTNIIIAIYIIYYFFILSLFGISIPQIISKRKI